MSDKKQTGRPLKTHAPGTEVTVSVLMPSELKTKLQGRAVEAKRTLSAEAQLRLERSIHSFDRPHLLSDAMQLAFGELGGIALMLAHAMERSGRYTAWLMTEDVAVWEGDAWLLNPTAFDQAVKTANTLLEAGRPPGRVETPDAPLDSAAMIRAFLSEGPDAPPYAADARRSLRPATLSRIRSNI